MILQRLYELAERENLLDDPAFETAPVPYVIKIGPGGQFLGIEDRRGVITIPAKKGPPKVKPGKGNELLVARPHRDSAIPGAARFFADTLARVLPISDDAKSAASRHTFWQQLEQAAAGTEDRALLDIQAFGRALVSDPGLVERVRNEIIEGQIDVKSRCTFAWHDDGGTTILDRDGVRTWWRAFYGRISGERQAAGPRGLCQITGEVGPMPTVHSTAIQGLPGGLPTGVKLVSNDKDAFVSYNLEGTANASVGYRAADGYTRAINALIAGKLPGNPHTRIRMGHIVFLFWTRNAGEAGDVIAQLENPDLAEVERLMKSAHAGHESYAADANDFFCLTLSGNAARAIVRDYLELPLHRVKQCLANWFSDLRLVDIYRNEITAAFPLWMLVAATAREMDEVAPAVQTQLLNAAIRDLPLPETVLAACVRRLHVEGDEGFRPARLALIKLVLNRSSHEGDRMTETLDPTRETPAYVCGRLLAVFERIQYFSLGDVNASVVDRYYGTASTAPALVFPRLFKSAEQHLSKLHGEKAGLAVNLQKELESITLGLKESKRFPDLLKLSEQGEFALGFYHQRASYRAAKPETN